MVQLTEVDVVFVAIVPVRSPNVYVNVCVKLELALLILIVTALPILPLPHDTVDFLAIVSNVNDLDPVQLTLDVYTAASKLAENDLEPSVLCVNVTVPDDIVPLYLSTLSVLVYTVVPAITAFNVLSAYHEELPPFALNVHDIVDVLFATD